VLPHAAPPDAETASRPACPAPANFLAEIADYDAHAEVGHWQGPRHRMTFRVLGTGPPLIFLPGIASTYRGFALTLNKLASRFKTIIPDYPGEHPDDGARLGSITHDHLVDDVFGLIEHLRIGRAFLVGTSFGSTLTLGALHREPRRFPRAVLQGAFAHRRFTVAEKLALAVGRHVPGTIDRLPLRRIILEHNSKNQFPHVIADRWPIYVEQNGLTPIAALAHRVSLLTGVDLRPKLADIPVEILLLHGNEDRIVRQSEFDLLRTSLPKSTGVLMPQVGHQPHFTHAEVFAQAIEGYLLPCAPDGCPSERNDPGH
jgi:pimeloyl-ACP methyl ester carboxylesterase